MKGLPRSLVVASVVMLLVRVAWVFRFREIDSDAYGHFFIAIAARRDPGNINVHWVWLPLYHFVVGALTSIGLTFRGLRVVNAILAGIGPLLLWDGLRRREGSGEESATLAATAFAIAPLTTILGQSAQPETLFLLFVVAAIHAAAREWPVRAGIWLALACMVRYEAWGATLALCICWLGWRRTRSTFAIVAIPAGLVAVYVLFRWWTDGTLLLFFRGTRDITKVQTPHEWTLRGIIDFPIVLPLRVIGPAIIALPLGLRRALTTHEKVMAAGFALFLLASYYAGGSHSGERYLVSLMPFAWIAVGAGALRLPRRRLEVLLLVVGATTIWHLHRAAGMAIAWDEGLREREMKLEADRVTP